MAVGAPCRGHGTTAVSSGHVLRAWAEAELTLVLVVAWLLADVQTLASIRGKLPTLWTFAVNAAFCVTTEAVCAVADFLEALVDVEASVTVGGKAVAFGTLAEVTSGYILTFSCKNSNIF